MQREWSGSDLVRMLDEDAAVEVAHQREQGRVPNGRPDSHAEPERQSARELRA